MDSDLAILCQSCGLCCDGSLFGRVRLLPHEVRTARRNRLRLVGDEGKVFEQPCAALVAAGPGNDHLCSCAIYRDRPNACRSFACRLYERHRREGGRLEPRLAAVQRVRELLANLEGLSPEPDHFEGGSFADDGALHDFSELVRRLEEDFARA